MPVALREAEVFRVKVRGSQAIDHLTASPLDDLGDQKQFRRGRADRHMTAMRASLLARDGYRPKILDGRLQFRVQEIHGRIDIAVLLGDLEHRMQPPRHFGGRFGIA